MQYCHIPSLSCHVSQNQPLAGVVHPVHHRAARLAWAGTAQFAASLICHISPLSFQGERCVWCRERCSCEADLGLGLNAGLSACASGVSLVCTGQYTWIALEPSSHQAAGGGSY